MTEIKKPVKQKFKHGDFLGVELNVGDFVSYSQSESSSLSLGIVVGFTKATVKVRQINVKGLSASKIGRYGQKEISRTPYQVAKLSSSIQELADLPDNYLEYFFGTSLGKD